MAQQGQDPNAGGGNNPKPGPKSGGFSRFVGVSLREVGKVALRGILVFFALLGVFTTGAIIFGKLPVQQRSSATTAGAPAKKLPELPKPLTIVVEPDGSGKVTRVIFETFSVENPYNMTDNDKRGIQEKLDYLHPQEQKRGSL